jgi:hypothetical protein
MSGRALHVHSHPSPVEHWRHLIEIVALIAAAVWAIYVFIYQERIKPASEPPELQTSLTVRHETVSRGAEFVKVDFDMKNIGHVPAVVDGLVINVYGTRFVSRSGESDERPLPGVIQLNRTLLSTRPVLLYSYFDVWKPFGAPAWKNLQISPDQVFRESFVFGIKPGSFDVARVVWTRCYSSTSDHVFGNARIRRRDGSYWLADWVGTTPRVTCGGQRRGEFFAL